MGSARLFLGTTDKGFLFQLLALDVAVTAEILPTLNSTMLGLQKIREMSVINLSYAVTRQILIVKLAFVTRSLMGLVLAWIVPELAVALALFKYVRNNIGPDTSNFPIQSLLKFSFPLFLQDIANYAYAWFDQMDLLMYLPLDRLGVYTTLLIALARPRLRACISCLA